MGDHLLSELSILRYRDCHVHLPCRVLAHSSPTLKPKLARSSPRATTVKPKLARSSPKTVKPELAPSPTLKPDLAPSPKGIRRSFNSPTLESSLARIGNMINIMDVDLLSDTVGGSYGRQEGWLHSPLIIAPPGLTVLHHLLLPLYHRMRSAIQQLVVPY
jgi:hypothetical protein